MQVQFPPQRVAPSRSENSSAAFAPCWDFLQRARSRAHDAVARQPLLQGMRLPLAHTSHSPSPVDTNAVPAEFLAENLWVHMLHNTPQGRQVVYNTLMALEGATLLQVKAWLEQRAPGALYDLVFKTPLLQRAPALVQHMKDHAPAVPVGRYIVSDIDNTFCPSRDRGFPKTATSYPGRAAFYEALVHPAPCAERVCFLSARFGDAICSWKWLSRRERRVTLENLRRGGMAHPRVLFGKLWDIPRPRLFGIDWTPMGGRKLRNFSNLGDLFPEYRYVFFGDTCQDDLRVGRAMLANANKRVSLVFMHDLGSRGRAICNTERAACARAGMIFYTTIPGAALAAYRAQQEQGTVSLGLAPDKLRHIANAALADLDNIHFDSPEQGEAAYRRVFVDVCAITDYLAAAAAC